jgi:DNA-binding GntR family transcriptional regulator
MQHAALAHGRRGSIMGKGMAARYAELAQSIVQEIAAGQMAVGDRLPSEVDMARQRGVSRATVRAALDIVEGLGLVSRRRRSGTRVQAAAPAPRYARSVATVTDLVQYAAETERHVKDIEEIVADDALAIRLACRPGQRWLNVKMVRTESGNGAAICWTEVYIDPAIGRRIRRYVKQEKGLICDIMQEKCGVVIVDITQSMRAVKLDARLGRLLHCATDDAALEITRHYKDGTGRVCQITISTHPGDRFEYRLGLRTG